MTEYVLLSELSKKPEILKKITASSGEELTKKVYIFEEEERVNISDAQIYQHIENLLQYIREILQDEVSPIYKEEQPFGSWPLKNWEKIETSKEEIFAWWEYVYYRDSLEEPSDA